MKTASDLAGPALDRLYDEGRKLFRRGRYEDAMDRFKRIYERTAAFRDIEEVVVNYYSLPLEEWIAKFRPRFKAQRARIRDLKRLLVPFISFVRQLFTKPRHWGRGGQGPGLWGVGELVPIRPTPPHHLVGAKEFPPSDKTHSFPWD